MDRVANWLPKPTIQSKSHFKVWRSLLQEIRKALDHHKPIFQFYRVSSVALGALCILVNSYQSICVVWTNGSAHFGVAHKHTAYMCVNPSAQTWQTFLNINICLNFFAVHLRRALLHVEENDKSNISNGNSPVWDEEHHWADCAW